ncbi:M1 family metallopeptidase [Actinacidiphila acididurans]|uniref:M1 family metallopeptidase n=1 Tax=Actinacidiphila acididurans TaxID=2784346 RepID=UPI0027DDBEC5|nr:M1 family metallopeptidase [Actinacidiphila acididurans]
MRLRRDRPLPPPRGRARGRSPAASRAGLTALLLTCCVACTGGGAVASGAPAAAPGLGDRLLPGAGNGGYDVTHYGLDLSYDPTGGRLTGTAVLTATATEAMSAFDLDLSGLTVGSVRVDGRPATFRRDGTELTVRPDRPLARGARFETTVGYAGVPQLLTDPDGSHEGWFRTDDGALALGEPVGAMAWFPCNDHPSDKAAYDLTVSVPAGLTAVSNGELAGTATRGGRTAYHWRTTAPMATYLATLGIGHYTVTRTSTPSGLPLYIAVDPRSDDPQTADALRRLPEVLDWESGLFGRYPFASSGAIVDHLPKGVGGYALETQNRPAFPGDAGAPAVRLDTLVHELSHQWFGDWATPASWSDIWLNEGFATYAEWLWQEHEGGTTVAANAAAALAGTSDWAFPPAAPPTAAQLFAPPVYSRGALVLYELRRTMGDRAFLTLLRTWPAAHAGGNATTAEFTAFAQRLTPHDLRPLFATWLYGSAKPAHL